MKLFTMYRTEDISATHNSNQANPADQPQFEGVVFDDGKVVLHWLTAKKSISVWDSFDDMMAIHGHPEYGSKLVWESKAPSNNIALSFRTVKRAYELRRAKDVLKTVTESRPEAVQDLTEFSKTLTELGLWSDNEHLDEQEKEGASLLMNLTFLAGWQMGQARK